MKTTSGILTAVLLCTAFMACNSKREDQTTGDTTSIESNETSVGTSGEARVVPGTYTNLNTGKEVYIVSDPQTGWAVDSISKVPVEFYINNSGDTLYQTGLVVNHAIMRTDGKWMLDETKIKREGDEIKIKFENGDKIKMDGDEIKSKDSEGKIKVDDDTIKVKTDNN